MLHFTLDGFGGHRSRYDDIRLIQELLEEVPARLGLQPVMPPMMLPYYNGVEPDDCGISGFVFSLAATSPSIHSAFARSISATWWRATTLSPSKRACSSSAPYQPRQPICTRPVVARRRATKTPLCIQTRTSGRIC